MRPHIHRPFVCGALQSTVHDAEKSPLSKKGEYLPFVAPIVTEGRPEEWLNHVEAAMRAATKRAIVRGLEDSKGEGELGAGRRACKVFAATAAGGKAPVTSLNCK
jgi:hypothetical protein